jgi:hypothetical protein
MGACRIQTRIALLLAACLSLALGQIAPSPLNLAAPLPYESFFRTVAQVYRFQADGHAEILTQPTLQEAIGLTDLEMEALHAVAFNCLATIRPLQETVPKLIFESRLRFVESGDSSAWLRPRLTDLDNQISQTLSHHIQRLKVAFGDSRFQQLDAWVRSPESQHCFVGRCTGEKR